MSVGQIAKTTAREFAKSENNEIVSVWNRTYEKAEKFTKKYGGTAYKTLEEAINDPRVEGVYIALTADRQELDTGRKSPYRCPALYIRIRKKICLPLSEDQSPERIGKLFREDRLHRLESCLQCKRQQADSS
ncbi:MAG: Gfo/Idh/MocA family oxidoreductase [Erysipelotrichaceae bacterium]|nr:Gfo/Idh/MocA family oxidoreductase [Erysipelotrichaceae bacterium]